MFTNVPTENGPGAPWIPPGLPAHMFGYAPGPLPRAVGEALSTGRALAGIGATAMGALAMLKNGMQPPLVIQDLTRGYR